MRLPLRATRIQFASGVAGTITLTSGELLINKNLTITGPGASVLAVSGNNVNRVFEITSGVTVALSGLTIKNGNAALGGGIYNFGGTLTITNSTVAGNSAPYYDGGGIYNYSTLTIQNTLLANNGSGGNCFASSSNSTSQGYNLSDDGTCASIFTATGDENNVVAGAGLASTTPQDNGGPTPTLALLPTSPAVDHIPVANCTVATDQRGISRPQGTNCDVGAFELVENAPTIGKSFGAMTMMVNDTTSLSFITTPNSNAITGVNFTDTLASGLVVAFPNGLSGSCDSGTITATAGTGTVSLSGASLAAGASCSFSVNVTGTTPGMKPNQVTVSSTQGTGNTANASVTVLMPAPPPAPPMISKSFEPLAIGVNESSTLSFTVMNPNTMAALSGVAFTDTLPVGLVVATPNGLMGSCGAGTITAVAGSSTISLSGGTLAANSSCTFSVRVTALATGLLPNTTGAVSATESGPGLTASATLTASSDAYQLNYASNLNLGDGVVNLTNSGAAAGANTPVVGQNSYGDICVNAYVYAPDQELATCCTCLVSPNSLHAWPVSFGTDNLLQNVKNQAVLASINQSHSVVLKLLATPAGGDLTSATGTMCPGPDHPGPGMTMLGGITGLANGLVAWGTHAHPTNTATAAITETAFVPVTLSGGELGKLTDDCRALLTQGGSRVCPACRTGGLAVSDTLQPKLP